MGRLGLVRSAVFFPVFFLLTFVVGLHFVAVGREGLARVLWYPVNGFAAFIAVQEVSWDAWELVFERLEADDDPEDAEASEDDRAERELKVSFDISTTFKVATAVLLSLFAVAGLGYAAWLSLPVVPALTTFVGESAAWYEATVLPRLEAAGVPTMA